MSQMEIDRVLAQIRNIAGAAKGGAIGGVGGLGATPTAPNGVNNGFANLLKQGIEKVNDTQFKAADMATKFEKGVPGVELSTVMIESQKATVAFRAATEVRNRLVNAYQEIMNMPI